MQAIVQHRYGGPEQLHLDEIDRPRPGQDEVLIRARAAGVDRAVWHLMTGTPLLARPFIGWRAPRRPVPGGDVAGVVESVGDRVTRWHPGDEVFGFGSSTFAEFALARADRLAAKPPGMEWTDAAASPMAGVTAVQALRTARVRRGSSVLVIGAGGGVGTFAVQLAAHAGAVVTAATRGDKVGMVRSLGATRVIDYSRDALDGQYDAILDIGGHRRLRDLRRLLVRRGALVFVGGEGGDPVTGGLHRNLLGMITGLFAGRRMTSLFATSSGGDLRSLAGLLGSGAVRSVVESAFSLAEGAEALRALEAGPAGKIVIVP